MLGEKAFILTNKKQQAKLDAQRILNSSQMGVSGENQELLDEDSNETLYKSINDIFEMS